MKEYLNQDFLLALKIDSLGKICIDRIKTIDPLENQFYFINRWIRNDKLSALQVLDLIKDDALLRELIFTKLDYCLDLDGSFQEISNDYQKIISYYQPLDPKIINSDDTNYEQKKDLLEDLIDRWIALSLDYTYDVCENDVKSGEILTYSHRRRGWSAPTYHLTENFDLEIATNFGYGRSSYFFTILSYKGIEIVPFSEWVLYEWAKLYDIIRYSSNHSLIDESWIEAFEFVKDAANLALEDENAFVNKYIIEECEKMVSGIENFLEGDTFRFLDEENKLKEVRKSGHELIEFRGEKITGALYFIQKILSLDKITSVNKFIKRIEECNHKIQPILQKELSLIKGELVPLEKEKSKLLPILKSLNEKYHLYEELKEVIRDNLVQENDYTFNLDVNLIFSVLHPKYQVIKENHDQTRKIFNEIIFKIKTLGDIKVNIISYIEKIDEYFNVKTKDS